MCTFDTICEEGEVGARKNEKQGTVDLVLMLQPSVYAVTLSLFCVGPFSASKDSSGFRRGSFESKGYPSCYHPGMAVVLYEQMYVLIQTLTVVLVDIPRQYRGSS